MDRYVDRVVISKRVLDRLIRAKLSMLDECGGVTALPVEVKSAPGRNGGCNWSIPGWTGEVTYVDKCQRKIKTYLEFLRGQFNVTEK